MSLPEPSVMLKVVSLVKLTVYGSPVVNDLF